MGMSDDDLSKVTMSSLVPDPDVGTWARATEYHAGAMPNGITYLFAAGAVVLPPLGIVAMLLAGRSWQRGRRGALLALLIAVLATAIGVAIWATVMPSTRS
jgi:hypothetical protein